MNNKEIYVRPSESEKELLEVVWHVIQNVQNKHKQSRKITYDYKVQESFEDLNKATFYLNKLKEITKENE